MNHKADDTRVLDMADMAQIGAFAFLLRQNTPHVEGDYARKFGDLTKLDKQSPTQDQIYQIILGSVSGPCWSVNTGLECGKRNARNHPQNHHYMGGTQTIPKWLGCYWVYHIRMFYGSKKMYHILTTTFNHQSSISLASFQEQQSFWHPAFYAWWCSFSTTNEGEIQRNSAYRLSEHWGKTIPWHGLSCVFPVSEYVAIKYDETPFKKKMKFGTALGNPKQ